MPVSNLKYWAIFLHYHLLHVILYESWYDIVMFLFWQRNSTASAETLASPSSPIPGQMALLPSATQRSHGSAVQCSADGTPEEKLLLESESNDFLGSTTLGTKRQKGFLFALNFREKDLQTAVDVWKKWISPLSLLDTERCISGVGEPKASKAWAEARQCHNLTMSAIGIHRPRSRVRKNTSTSFDSWTPI